jgi:excisionase family DNA binding protein
MKAKDNSFLSEAIPVQPSAGSNSCRSCVKEAAAFLNVSKSFIDKLRCHGGGPLFVRLGSRKILYRRTDLENWARQRRYDSTSQYPDRNEQ